MSQNDSKKPSARSQEAADWLMKNQMGGLSTPEQVQFETWLSADPVNQRAYQKLQRVWMDLSDLPLEDIKGASALKPLATADFVAPTAAPARNRRQSWMLRRPIRMLAGALAASLVVAITLRFDLDLRFRADAVTATGEVRSMALPDGSTALLNTGSAIRLHYTNDERVVDVLAGEVDFTVVANPRRPFVVEAAGGRTRALGTEFVVRRLGNGATVTGVVHTIAVSYTQTGVPPQTVTLIAGQQAHYSPNTGLRMIQTAADPENARAWTRGRLIFEDEPLGEVVAELNRYHKGLIRITDSRLNGLKVSGVFTLNDPIGVVDTLERSFGVHSTRFTDYLVLIHD